MDFERDDSFYDIDLTNCHTREERIKKIIENKMLDYLFSFLNDDEKDEYYIFLSYNRLYNYLSSKTEDFVFKHLTNHFDRLSEYDIVKLLDFIDNDKLKFKIIERLIENDYMFFIEIASKKIDSDLYKIKVIELLIKKEVFSLTYAPIVGSLGSDENKKLFFPFLSLYERVNIIKDFSDKSLIKEFALNEEYLDFQSDLVIATFDKDFIREMFLNVKVPVFRNNVINKIDDLEFKLELINLLDDKNVKIFFLSNFSDFSKDFLVEVDDEDFNEDRVDRNITIGVELECANEGIMNFEEINSIFEDFMITGDISVKNGFEIVSPILHYTREDMGKLKSVCEFLKKCDFYTNSSCGGHIHIGADYIKNRNELYMLLYLYNNCENIIYLICNREHSRSRRNINKYAKTTKKAYLEACGSNLLNGNLTNEETVRKIVGINTSRNMGLNLKNINDNFKHTIEFRMPNGEIDFDELLCNIKLFAMLVQRSYELVNDDLSSEKKNLVEKLSHQMPESKRLEIFLNILFDSEEERDIYYKRYHSNISFIKSMSNKLFYGNEEFLQINDDSKRLSLKKWFCLI